MATARWSSSGAAASADPEMAAADPPLAGARTGAALAEQVGGIMMRRRALALAAGDTRAPAVNRPGTAVIVGAIYLTVSVALIW